MKTLIWIVGLMGLMGTLALAACGSDDSGPSCATTSKKLCEKACACTANGKCAIGNAGATITFDNQAGCEGLYSLGCSQAGSSTVTIDWAACSTALDSAACTMGTENKYLEAPASCDN